MSTMTKETAIHIYESGLWQDLTNKQIAELYFLVTGRLFCPFDVLHGAVTEALNRDVFNHEFANREGLTAEYLGDRPAPTLEEILAQIPAEKAVVFFT